jgi:hypothetical protein
MTDNSAFLAALGNFYVNFESGESYSCLGARTSLASAYSRAGGQAPYSLTTATTSGCFSSLFEYRTRQTRETISTATRIAPTEPPTAPAISDVLSVGLKTASVFVVLGLVAKADIGGDVSVVDVDEAVFDMIDCMLVAETAVLSIVVVVVVAATGHTPVLSALHMHTMGLVAQSCKCERQQELRQLR